MPLSEVLAITMSDPSTSIARHYHDRTKYDPRTIASRSRALDFDQQPSPFKTYQLGKTIDLKAYLKGQPSAADQDWYRLSRLLYFSYGITGLVPYPNNPFYLRAAPSAGGLYPAEVYLLSRGTGLEAGLYNYQAKTHSLLQFWDNPVWTELQTACLQHPSLAATDLAIVITAVFFRSSWRYEDRAYRRIFLDSGHLLGNFELAGSLSGYRPHLIGGFLDQSLDQLLYLDTEAEGAIAVLALEDQQASTVPLPLAPTALPSTVQTDYPPLPDGQLLSFCHRATQIDSPTPTYLTTELPQVTSEDKYNFPFCTRVSLEVNPIQWQPQLEGLETTLLHRRSTRRYTGENLTLAELAAVLDFSYHPEHYAEQGLDPHPDYFDLSLIETFVAVSGVTGLEEGCYYYAPKAGELRQIRFKNFRRELHYLCLQQELGRDAAAVVFHTADLQRAIESYGDRVYRYLHLDAGHLGQRLNLAAIHLNLGVSGIGGFFDDHVNEVLGIPADEAVLYITTLGRPG